MTLVGLFPSSLETPLAFLVEHAGVIAIVRITDDGTATRTVVSLPAGVEPFVAVSTGYQAQVERVLKSDGGAFPPTIIVAQAGGITDGIKYQYEGYPVPLLGRGQRVLVFMGRDSTNSFGLDGPYGAFLLSPRGIVFAADGQTPREARGLTEKEFIAKIAQLIKGPP